MNQKIEEYINNLVDECIKADGFSQVADKSDAKEKITDHLYQTVINELLNYLTKEELDQLETINFESEEGMKQFGGTIAELPGFAFLNVGDKLRQNSRRRKSIW